MFQFGVSLLAGGLKITKNIINLNLLIPRFDLSRVKLLVAFEKIKDSKPNLEYVNCRIWTLYREQSYWPLYNNFKELRKQIPVI